MDPDLQQNAQNISRFIDIRRDVIDWDQFDVKYERKPQKEILFYESILEVVNKWWQKFSLFHWFESLFPIIQWLPKYKFKSYLFRDFIAGITISILHIPQGIANALIADLDAVTGLYVSFFPVLIYTLMGTSRHISIGSFAVASLMLSNTASKLGAVPTRLVVLNATTNQTTQLEWPPTNLEVLTTICIVSGLIQIVMGFMSLGSLSVIMSKHLMSGFTTGLAFHVATTQMSYIFGLNIDNGKSSLFRLVKTWVKIAENLPESNVTSIVCSAIVFTTLVVFKEWFEPIIKTKISFPIPIDLIVVIISILMSWVMELNKTYRVFIIGHVPTGLPHPSVPRLDFIGDIFIDCVILAAINFTVSLSLAEIFALKHKYVVDANQELIALGSANVFASFFSSYTASAAMSRSTIQDRIGGKTQLAGLFSCMVILSVILVLAPILYHLPKCTLSCIIIIALKAMFMQIGDLTSIWFVSKLDATVWLVTFLSIVFLDIALGLYVGLSICLVVILIRFIKPTSSQLGCLPSTEIYVDIEKYMKAEEVDGLKIFRFCAPIFYLSIDNFKSKILKLTKVNTNRNDSENEMKSKSETRALIIDMSCVPFMDKSGVEAITEMVTKLNDYNIAVCLVSCPLQVIEMFERTNFFNSFNKKSIYPTIHDAVLSLS